VIVKIKKFSGDFILDLSDKVLEYVVSSQRGGGRMRRVMLHLGDVRQVLAGFPDNHCLFRGVRHPRLQAKALAGL